MIESLPVFLLMCLITGFGIVLGRSMKQQSYCEKIETLTEESQFLKHRLLHRGMYGDPDREWFHQEIDSEIKECESSQEPRQMIFSNVIITIEPTPKPKPVREIIDNLPYNPDAKPLNTETLAEALEKLHQYREQERKQKWGIE